MSGVNRVTKAVLEAEVKSFIADMERAGEAAAGVGRKTESAARQATRVQREQAAAAKQAADAQRAGRKAFDAITWFDKTIIDGAVNGVAGIISSSSGELSRTQTGRVRNYAIGIASGAIVVLVYVIVRMSS